MDMENLADKKVQHIILTGFMGTGKSTIGRRLANRLNLIFIDTDHEIEKEEGKSIPEIFNQHGEDYFREVESELFIQLLSNENQKVISTGGGIILSQKNRKAMLNHQVILLEASIDEIMRRVKENENRPLLNQGVELKERISHLIQERKKYYSEVATIKVNTDDKKKEDIINEIITLLDF